MNELAGTKTESGRTKARAGGWLACLLGARSIRRRIQLWQGLILLLVVVGFGTLLYERFRQARFREIDSELNGAAQSLRAALASLPPILLERDDPGSSPVESGAPPRGGLVRAQADRLLSKVKPPDGFVARYDQPPDRRPYFVILRASGKVMLQSPTAPDPMPSWPGGLDEGGAPLFVRRGSLQEVFLAGPAGTNLVVGRSIASELGELRSWLILIVSVGAVLVVAGAVGGAYLVERSLRSLHQMSQTAARISANHLSERIDRTHLDSELEELAGTLNETFASLESSFTRQARFTADASHELRTPLAVLMGKLDQLEGESGDERAASVEMCRRAVRRMKSLIEGLLVLARVDAGQLALSRQVFDLTAIAEECVELLSPLARQHEVSLELEGPDLELDGDPRLIAQVVMNLATNAIRYNRPHGSVRVKLHDERNDVVLSVADTGLGIPAAQQPHIFERFFRADRSRSRASGGSGLGLSIARSIVLLHGGEITFHSEEGRGTEFIVRLPKQPADPIASRA